MTVTVIREGFLPDNQRMGGRCHYCKTEVECLASDTRQQEDGRNGTDHYVRCPLAGCGRDILVLSKP